MGATHPIDRRPIAAREWAVSAATASWLARRGVTPNAISVAGMVAGMAAGAALAATSFVGAGRPALCLAAAGLVLVRLLANMLDGMVAVATARTSALGMLFNEIPDRVSDSAILIGLGHAPGGSPALGYLAALAAMFTAYVRAVGSQAGARQEFCGPMAKPHRMAAVIGVALVGAVAPQVPLAVGALALIAVGSVLTALRRLRRQAVQLREELA